MIDIAGKDLTDHFDVKAEAQLKTEVRGHQTKVAKLILQLQEASDSLKEVAPLRKKETKRWQANYDYVAARLEAQIAYLNEYEAVLGQIQKGLAPPDPALYKGWRLASQYDAQTGDSASKKLGNESRKKMDKIIDAYPNTPWSILRGAIGPAGSVWNGSRCRGSSDDWASRRVYPAGTSPAARSDFLPDGVIGTDPLEILEQPHIERIDRQRRAIADDDQFAASAR